jgi:NAD(P)-dependent dehydrogenase (short-subunit alcohol dehydrogenase family)
MTKRLENRIALITGASRGIGAAIAKRFASEGAHVILAARTVGGLEEVDDVIKAKGGQSTLVPLDLREGDKIDQLGAVIAERFGKLDILVGNAGFLGDLTPVAHLDPSVWDRLIAVNATANYRLIRSFDPLLRRSDAGRALFVTSGVTQDTQPFWGGYAASKAALESLVAHYAEEVKNTHIRANVIDPGAVGTDMLQQAYPGNNMAEYPQPNEVTDLFVDLASEECSFSGERKRVSIG